MTLAQYLGDKKIHKIPIRWARKSFDPAAAYNLIFTIKANSSDGDEEAVVQKGLDDGITTSSGIASVSLEHLDTKFLSAGAYTWDIQALNLSDATDVRTLNRGKINLLREITRSSMTTTIVGSPSNELDFTPMSRNWSSITVGDTYPAQRFQETISSTDLARVRIKVKDASGATLLTLDSDTSGVTITTATAGAWDYTIDVITAATTSGLAAGIHFYDQEITDSVGDVSTEFAGTWELLEQITN